MKIVEMKKKNRNSCSSMDSPHALDEDQERKEKGAQKKPTSPTTSRGEPTTSSPSHSTPDTPRDLETLFPISATIDAPSTTTTTSTSQHLESPNRNSVARSSTLSTLNNSLGGNHTRMISEITTPNPEHSDDEDNQTSHMVGPRKKRGYSRFQIGTPVTRNEFNGIDVSSTGGDLEIGTKLKRKDIFDSELDHFVANFNNRPVMSRPLSDNESDQTQSGV